MRIGTYAWRDDAGDHELRLIEVPGTDGTPFPFCAQRRPTEVRDFHIGATPVTQALWAHVMGSNPAKRPELRAPVENVSWQHIRESGGFLDRINDSEIRRAIAGDDDALRFRLPSETEWEYAARGGPHWRDGFDWAGSNDPDDVAWYGPRWTRAHNLVVRLFGWRFAWRQIGVMSVRMQRLRAPSHTHPVATKTPNQLGIFDMSGNVWEWCEDACVDDLDAVPRDGRPYPGPSDERRLRGGCFNNWDLHCRVWWRYGITPDAHDGCIGFRLVLARD